MKFTTSLCVFVALWVGGWMPAAGAQSRLGAQGSEGVPARRQSWLVPSLSNKTARAILFRPPGDGPFPLAVIARGTMPNALRRAQMPRPDYRTLAVRLVARGYAVIVPERPGHGATGGRDLEDHGGCDDANYLRAGRATADTIAAALDYMREQNFIRPEGDLIVGHSAGGWGALALAGRNPTGVSAIAVFAPGHGGRANDKANQVCAPQRLIAAAAEFGKDAHVSVVWVVARNDSYFAPALSRQMVDGFRSGGDKVDFRELPDFRKEGHFMAEAEGGDEIYGPTLDSALKAVRARPVRKR